MLAARVAPCVRGIFPVFLHRYMQWNRGWYPIPCPVATSYLTSASRHDGGGSVYLICLDLCSSTRSISHASRDSLAGNVLLQSIESPQVQAS